MWDADTAYNAGIADAQAAVARRETLGLPAGPILFVTDPDMDRAVTAAYLRGVSVVIGAANIVTRETPGA